MTGFDLIKAAKAEDNTLTRSHFIMLNMVSDLKSVRQAIDHGCHDFITKPFAPIRLLKAVKYAVKQLERQNEQSLVQSMATEELDTFHIG